MSAPAPGTPEWARIMTASKVPAVLGVSPWESPYSLWMKMTGRAETDSGNENTRRGQFLEDGILDWYLSRHPDLEGGQRQQYVHRDGWMGATLDYAIGDTIVEVKTARDLDEWGDENTDVIPAYYLPQVYWQLHVSGATVAHVAVLGPFFNLREYIVEADAAIGADLENRMRAFYDTLDADEPPALDNTTATYDVVRKQHPDIDKGEGIDLAKDAATEYVAACLDLDAAEARARLAKAHVLTAMQRTQFAWCNGVKVARRQPSKAGVSLVRVARTPDFASTEGAA